MRFTKYGMRELGIYGTVAGVIMILAIVLSFSYVGGVSLPCLISLPFILTFIWVLSFFRDPKRPLPRGEHRMVAPADGVIFDIGDIDEPDFIGEECTRIGIFLSIFDCHINRIPCSGTVGTIRYKRGAFFSALKARQCSKRNESNFIGISNAAGTGAMIGVKQIAGQIARRIVCDLKEGAEVERGQQFGMIKFGSRTEIFIPKSANFNIKVKLGAAVRAGRTVIGTLEPFPDDEEAGEADEQ
jgi:phosphatidylserine decarboxylase